MTPSFKSLVRNIDRKVKIETRATDIIEHKNANFSIFRSIA
jgi:hypothetical protein